MVSSRRNKGYLPRVTSLLGLTPISNVPVVKIVTATNFEVLLLQALQFLESELIVVVAAAATIMAVETTLVVRGAVVDTVNLKTTQLYRSDLPHALRMHIKHTKAMRILVTALETLINRAKKLFLDLAMLLPPVWKLPPELRLFSTLATFATLIRPAKALHIGSTISNPRHTLDHVEIITVGTVGPNTTEIVVMLLVGFLGVVVLTPIMGFSDHKRVLNASLALASWAYWVVYGTGILPWSFIM